MQSDRSKENDFQIGAFLATKLEYAHMAANKSKGSIFWDTYAPVVQWSTVRLVLVLSALSNLKTRQVDYVQAYTHADIDCDLYMHVPAGFSVIKGKLTFVDGLCPKGMP